LKAPFIREKLPKISKWATFPQLFINGELVGGCDIIESMSNDGSLLPMLQAAVKTDSTVVTHSEVSNLIAQAYPKAKISIEGQGCDLTISVVSEDFAGLPLVKQHQGVMATLNDVLASGRLHAITLKTSIPEEAQPAVQADLLQIQS
jgi:monothiol glutaredoxin